MALKPGCCSSGWQALFNTIRAINLAQLLRKIPRAVLGASRGGPTEGPGSFSSDRQEDLSFRVWVLAAESLLCFLALAPGELRDVLYFLLNSLPLLHFFFSAQFLEKTVQKNALPPYNIFVTSVLCLSCSQADMWGNTRDFIPGRSGVTFKEAAGI